MLGRGAIFALIRVILVTITNDWASSYCGPFEFLDGLCRLTGPVCGVSQIQPRHLVHQPSCEQTVSFRLVAMWNPDCWSSEHRLRLLLLFVTHQLDRPFRAVNHLTAPFLVDSRGVRGGQRYEEAGRHILDALTLQNSDAAGDARGGVTSDALWNSFETVCHKMGLADLMDSCVGRDLDSEYLHMCFLPRLSCAESVVDWLVQ